MRYTAHLHTSRRPHILKNGAKSTIISGLWLCAIFVGLSLVVNFSHLDTQTLFEGFIVSLARVSIAYCLALIAALVIALAITSHKIIEDLLLPVFDVLQSFPTFALFPVLIVALKNSPEIIIILVLSLSMVWEILFSIIGGVKNRRQDWEEAATIFGATGLKRLLYFTIPVLMPALITGSIIGWGEGWEFIIGAELLVKTNVGIGYYLGLLGQQQHHSNLAFGIIILLILLFVINKLLWLPLLNKVTAYSVES